MSLYDSQLIPAARLPAVEAALLQAFGSADLSAIAILAGGLSSSAVYKITLNQQHYVLKLDAPQAAAPTALSGNMFKPAAGGIAPPLYYLDALNGISISGFIDSKPIHGALSPGELAQQLAGTIRAIHKLPYLVTENNLAARVDALIDGFRQSKVLTGAVPDECFNHYALLQSKYPWNDPDRVFSHNDLNPGNILYDGKRLWVIDWDAAHANDRYVDLATAANFFMQINGQEEVFLKAYFGRAATATEQAQFYLMRLICRIVYAMMMFGLAAQSKLAGYAHDQTMEGIGLKEFGALMGAGKLSLATYEGQLFYGKALLNEVVQQMGSARFRDSLAWF